MPDWLVYARKPGRVDRRNVEESEFEAIWLGSAGNLVESDGKKGKNGIFYV